MVILGIETTCDETAAALVERTEDGKGRILSNIVLSQVSEHAEFGGVAAQSDGVRKVGDVKLLARAVEGIDLKDLRSLADEGKRQVGSGVVAIVGVTEEGKAGLVVGVTADLTSRFSAVDLARKGAEALCGKGGGGRPDMAQAGGPDGSKADAALAAIAAALGGG